MSCEAPFGFNIVEFLQKFRDFSLEKNSPGGVIANVNPKAYDGFSQQFVFLTTCSPGIGAQWAICGALDLALWGCELSLGRPPQPTKDLTMVGFDIGRQREGEVFEDHVSFASSEVMDRCEEDAEEETQSGDHFRGIVWITSIEKL